VTINPIGKQIRKLIHQSNVGNNARKNTNSYMLNLLVGLVFVQGNVFVGVMLETIALFRFYHLISIFLVNVTVVVDHHIE
jgi:hypothetical protein